MRVSVVLSTAAPPCPNRTVAIRSADSQTSFTQYCFVGVSPLRVLRAKPSAAHKRVGLQANRCRSFKRLSGDSCAFYRTCSVNLALDAGARLLRHFSHADHAFSY